MIMKILIIEDDQDMRQMTCEMLTANGFEVITAQNGQLGLDIITNITVDIILTDLLLPGLGGIELLDKIREYNIPAITMSGLSKEVVIDELLGKLGISGVLQKPFKEKDLLEKIKKASQSLQKQA